MLDAAFLNTCNRVSMNSREGFSHCTGKTQDFWFLRTCCSFIVLLKQQIKNQTHCVHVTGYNSATNQAWMCIPEESNAIPTGIFLCLYFHYCNSEQLLVFSVVLVFVSLHMNPAILGWI